MKTFRLEILFAVKTLTSGQDTKHEAVFHTSKVSLSSSFRNLPNYRSQQQCVSLIVVMPRDKFESRSDLFSTCLDGKPYEPRSIIKVKNEITDTPNVLYKSTGKNVISIGK